MAVELQGYLIKKQIGTGAGSKLYAAVENKTRRTVCIKHVIRRSPEDDRFLAQAETEYEVGSTLNHPSLRRADRLERVRKLLQVKELFLVMEFVEGLNLETARPNRLNTFLAVFQKVAEGLGAMHDAGYLHTDIKPTNIMVVQGGGVKIIDFGQSCPMDHRKERIQGTPDYIAPEQVRRLPLTRSTDVFNLGATMYWVLTSTKYPTEIQGIDTQPGANIIRSKKPVAPIELNDKIPTSLSQLVMDCCRENPSDRPSNMKQIIARLQVVSKVWNKFRNSFRAAGAAAPIDGTAGTNDNNDAPPSTDKA